MIHFLRTKGKSIVDLSATENDLSCVICIDEYSKFLLNNIEKSKEIIEDFDMIQEIRGIFFETPNMKYTPDELSKKILVEIGKKYGLQYVTD